MQQFSNDEDMNLFLSDVISSLEGECGYSNSEASDLVANYYKLFLDGDYCAKIGIPVQDDEFLYHEGVGGMALRVHYYLGLKLDPNPKKFIEWRSS